MPSWLRVPLLVLLVLLVVVTGVPVLTGGASMHCETCPSTGAVTAPSCAAVLVSAFGIALLAGALTFMRSREERRLSLLLALDIERPPQFG